MSQTVIGGDLHVAGAITAQSLTVPSGSIGNNGIQAGAGIASTKLQQRPKLTLELFGPTTAVAALTKWLHIVRGATGTVKNIGAMIAVVASGADRTITLDLKKSTGGGAFATILSATFGFTNASTALVLVNGTISSAGLVAGDVLEITVAVAGAAGAQATGLTVSLQLEEDPE